MRLTNEGEKAMKKRLAKSNMLTPVLLALFWVAAPSAFADQPDVNTVYQITARHSGKCLEVNGGPSARGNGALVVQRDCNNAENQRWFFTYVGGGLFKITAKHSSKSLDVFGGIFSTANDVIVEQYEYNGSANQMWTMEDLHNGYYAIIASHSRKSLRIRGDSVDNGAQVIQSDYNMSSENQQWKLTDVNAKRSCRDTFTSTLTGTATFNITIWNTPLMVSSSVSLPVKFTDCPATISITDFPPLRRSVVLPFPIGRNTFTLTMSAGGPGHFEPANGRIVLPIELRLQNTSPLLGNSTLPLVLVATGAEMTSSVDGHVTLRGSGTVVGGALGGSPATMVITGNFSPRPR